MTTLPSFMWSAATLVTETIRDEMAYGPRDFDPLGGRDNPLFEGLASMTTMGLGLNG